MGPNQKINLNAIMKNSSGNDKTDEIIKKTKNKDKKSFISTKSNINNSIPKKNSYEILKSSHKKISLSNIKGETESKKNENLKLNEKKSKIEINQKKDKKIKKDVNITIEKKKNEESEMFSNYTSDFKKHENIILKKIKKLKNLPKTNPKFLATIITLSIITIVFALNFDPKHQSINNYKQIISKTIGINNNWQEEEINLRGFKFKFESKQTIDGINIDFYKADKKIIKQKAIYKYKSTTYLEKKELISNLNKEVIKLENEKIILKKKEEARIKKENEIIKIKAEKRKREIIKDILLEKGQKQLQ